VPQGVENLLARYAEQIAVLPSAKEKEKKKQHKCNSETFVEGRSSAYKYRKAMHIHLYRAKC